MVADIIVVAVVAIIVGAVVRKIVKNIKNGKSICGCGCECDKCPDCDDSK